MRYFHFIKPSGATLLCVAIALSIAACNRQSDQIQVYRLVKAPLEPGDDQASAPSMNPMADAGGSTSPNAAPSVPVPPNWEAQAPSQMRQASFLVHGDNGAVADISFVALGPAAGNVLDNVNRWLGQLSQPPLTAEQLNSTVQKLSAPGGEVEVVDLTGKPEDGNAGKDGRIIGAIAVEPKGTSFYKMRGNAELVGKEKENFLKWVGSMRAGQGPSAAAPMMPSSAAKAGAETPEVKWELPAGWSAAPASAMRYASFSATAGNGEKIDISVVTFPGEGGGDLENMNRWRQQIGLGPIDEKAAASAIVPVKGSVATFSTVDFTGAKSRMLAAWVRRDDRVWFFKLTGSPAAVEMQKANFGKFVESVRF